MKEFDDVLLFNLKGSLTRLSRTQMSWVEKAFRYVQNYQGVVFNSESEFLINALSKKEKKTTVKGPGRKLSEAQIVYVEAALKSLIAEHKHEYIIGDGNI